jgi:hypothetical protein
MIRDMILVQSLRGVLGRQQLGFIVALHTFSFRNMAIALDDAEMTFFTRHTPGNIFSMIKVPSFNIDVSFRLNVAGGTSSHRTRKAVFFPFGTGLKIVTDKTIGFMNREMFPLNELGMTGGATKFHAPSQFPQVLSVREGHILVNHIAL